MITFFLYSKINVILHFVNTKTIMDSEKQKQIEKERKAVLQLLLKKAGLKYQDVVDFQLNVWMSGNLDLLTEQEKKQFPHLAF